MKNRIVAAATLYILGIVVIVHSADAVIFQGGSMWNILFIVMGFAISIFGRTMFENED